MTKKFNDLISEAMKDNQKNSLNNSFKEGDIVLFLSNPLDEYDDGSNNPNPKWVKGKIIDLYGTYDADILQLSPRKMHYSVMQASIKPVENKV